MKILKSSIIGAIVLFVIAAVATATLVIKQNLIDIVINDNITPLVHNVKYRTPAIAGEVLELGGEIEKLTNAGILAELQKRFPEYEVKIKKNLANSELLDLMYDSLTGGTPILCLIGGTPILCLITETDESAPEGGAYLGVVAKMDIPSDLVTLCGPDGFQKPYGTREFLKAARFESGGDTELFAKLKFALEIITKNTVFVLEEKEEKPG